MEKNLLVVSSSPHLHSEKTVSLAMRDVLLALLPALGAALYFFGLAAAKVISVCVLAAVLSEAVVQKIRGQQITVDDYSAVLTGLLLAFCLPATLPLWMAALGAIIAIVLGKQLFGGLGNNIFNPALVGRAVLLASWPVAMTNWEIDGITMATPLVKETSDLAAMFWGNIGGSLGETCAFALLLGALYLLYKGHIDWRIPFAYLATVFVLTGIYGSLQGQGLSYPLYHLLAGGLILGAFFMATDWVTSPLTRKGRWIFGLGCGLLTVLIRLQGGYPEGVCYSILLMNMVTPLIDRYTKPRVFGGVSKNA